ncbi:nitroreductase family deazaflavin-dependent oxidoreductase [Cryobacterium adonitolivorans]|nr:nitroreductase family deazaflavin-dependent oxidoreductase [Cryobacterium adonitolivorans]
MNRDESLRQMYAGGRPNRRARFLNRISALVFSLGIVGHGAVSLETVNPKSRTLLTLPLVVARYEGGEYVVSMLGQGSRWVRNVRAANGKAVIHAGRRRQVLLEEVRADARPPILKAFLAQAPGARPHFPVDRSEPVAAFETIAADFPVFKVRDVR